MNELTKEDWEKVRGFVEEIRKTLRYLEKFSERKDLFGVCVECGVLRTLAESLHDFVNSKWVRTSEVLRGEEAVE